MSAACLRPVLLLPVFACQTLAHAVEQQSQQLSALAQQLLLGLLQQQQQQQDVGASTVALLSSMCERHRMAVTSLIMATAPFSLPGELGCWPSAADCLCLLDCSSLVGLWWRYQLVMWTGCGNMQQSIDMERQHGANTLDMLLHPVLPSGCVICCVHALPCPSAFVNTPADLLQQYYHTKLQELCEVVQQLQEQEAQDSGGCKGVSSLHVVCDSKTSVWSAQTEGE